MTSDTHPGQLYAVSPPLRLADISPDDTGGLAKKSAAAEELESLSSRLSELQERLYVERLRSILIVLQAIDTGGKDGLVKHLYKSLNPVGCVTVAFKAPTPVEQAHDFLWRIHPHAPARGMITIFNRSHYEDVIVPRVRGAMDEASFQRRCQHIAEFEQLLLDNDTTVIKLLLHISRDEQKRRLESRLKDPRKHWKFNLDDLAERARWDEYQTAFEDVINRTSTPQAPWHVVPANKKWFRNLTVSRILTAALEQLDPQYPKPDFDPSTVHVPD